MMQKSSKRVVVGEHTRPPEIAGNEAYVRRVFAMSALLALCFLLSACPSAAPVTPDADTGSLQVTVLGLPEEAEAEVVVTGPEDYRNIVTGSRTLTDLRTGAYTLMVETVTYQGVSYTGLVEPARQAQLTVEVAREATVTVEVRYSLVGEVGEGEIAPGVTRAGTVAEKASDDYRFQGLENVPLTFDFLGTGEERRGAYSVLIYHADDTGEPLVSLTRMAHSQPPVVGFSPPETGAYVLRVRGEGSAVDYRVSAAYLNGPPEARRTAALLEYGASASGAVTAGSHDAYRFPGNQNEPVVLTFSYDREDGRYRGLFFVEVYRAGAEAPLYTSPSYRNYNTAPAEVTFTPPENGDYLLRVVGAGEAGASLVRYRFLFERLE